MTKQQAIKEIKKIMADVEENWLANDGGLTMAASDLLAFGRYVIEDIKKGRLQRIMELSPFDCSTGAESDIVTIAQEWAEETKTRRRIEERLRKDPQFFERAKIILNNPDCVAFLWDELLEEINKAMGATLAIKISNILDAKEEYKQDLEQANQEISRLAHLLYKNDVRFQSEHPYARKYSLASRAPKNMQKDLLNG